MAEASAESVLDDVRGVVRDVLDKGDATWSALAEAGLLGLAAPEEYDGSGHGLPEVGVLIDEVGRRAADLPVRDTLAGGLLTLVACGSAEQQGELIPRIVAGDLWLTPALAEPGDALPAHPLTRLDDGAVSGTKVRVPVRDGLLLVSTDSGAVIVDPSGPGVTTTRNPSSTGRPEASYVFDGAPALHVLGEGSVEVLRRHVMAGAVLEAAGLLAGARDLTSGYIAERTQFGRRLAEFQAVAMQIADV